ncbi:hypothetical protein SSCG_02287 [Streptomyces clavuligerus]|nr:hypothetical protein SSCG_02287 [Streptomyces clavuligerus]
MPSLMASRRPVPTPAVLVLQGDDGGDEDDAALLRAKHAG